MIPCYSQFDLVKREYDRLRNESLCENLTIKLRFQVFVVQSKVGGGGLFKTGLGITLILPTVLDSVFLLVLKTSETKTTNDPDKVSEEIFPSF